MITDLETGFIIFALFIAGWIGWHMRWQHEKDMYLLNQAIKDTKK